MEKFNDEKFFYRPPANQEPLKPGIDYNPDDYIFIECEPIILNENWIKKLRDPRS